MGGGWNVRRWLYDRPFASVSVTVLLLSDRWSSLPRLTLGSFLGLPESVALFSGFDETHVADKCEFFCQEVLDLRIRQGELYSLFWR